MQECLASSDGRCANLPTPLPHVTLGLKTWPRMPPGGNSGNCKRTSRWSFSAAAGHLCQSKSAATVSARARRPSLSVCVCVGGEDSFAHQQFAAQSLTSPAKRILGGKLPLCIRVCAARANMGAAFLNQRPPDRCWSLSRMGCRWRHCSQQREGARHAVLPLFLFLSFLGLQDRPGRFACIASFNGRKGWEEGSRFDTSRLFG